MNTVCGPRMPGEQMGAICRLKDETDSTKEIVINVEYNQLDALLREKWNPEGDVKSDNGYSSFPGNTNTLVFKIPEYYENLTKTGGVIPEFVNPKYANAEKTLFKSPTRLECMMQDYPKLLSSTGEVGFTMYETWFCYSPAKFNIKDAQACIAKGIPSNGAAEAEYNFYNWTTKMLRLAGVEIEEQTEAQFGFKYGPKILMDPTFAITLKELKSKFKGTSKISKDASVVLQDMDLEFENLDLGAGKFVCKSVGNEGSEAITFVPVDDSDKEIYKIRGFKPSNA